MVELDTGHRTIRHKSNMRHCVKSEEKISERQVCFGPRVEYSDGSYTQAESTHDKPDRPMTRLRAALREKNRTVWPSQHQFLTYTQDTKTGINLLRLRVGHSHTQKDGLSEIKEIHPTM